MHSLENKGHTEEVNITHSNKWESLDEACKEYKKRINSHAGWSQDVKKQYEAIIDEMTKFPMGRHILLTGGANGVWTDYMITYPWVQKNIPSKLLTLNRLEYNIIFECLSVVAQRELFLMAQCEAQKQVKEGCRLASVPCGVFRDLLTLDFSGVKSYSLIGVDIDDDSLEAAKRLAFELGRSNVEFVKESAWEFDGKESLDFINSIGLNVYESDRQKVIGLYSQFHKSLKPGGVLFTGVLTYPPGYEKESCWRMDLIPPFHYEMDKVLIDDVLELHWKNYRTFDEIKNDFYDAGFSDVTVVSDKYCIFPGIIAVKGR